jgi:hypothetical protein
MKISGFAICLFLLMLSLGFAVEARQESESKHQQHQHPKAEAGKPAADNPSKDAHSQHLCSVNERGDHAMGFSHEKATHHFKLASSGGAIEVSANDPNDLATLNQIREHLSHIAALFKEGDFSKPMFTHGEMPPGASAMTRLKNEIAYKFQETDRGGKVIINTPNDEALSAIHQFLRFQITDHATGDPLDISPDK